MIIEVEYIGNIIRLVQFERFYLDRIFYYSLTSLQHFFAEHDMIVADVEHVEPHGGSLQLTIKRKEEGATPSIASMQFSRKKRKALRRATSKSLDKQFTIRSPRFATCSLATSARM